MIPHKLVAKLFSLKESLQKRIRAFCSENVSFWTLIFQIFINQNLNTTCHYFKKCAQEPRLQTRIKRAAQSANKQLPYEG